MTSARPTLLPLAAVLLTGTSLGSAHAAELVIESWRNDDLPVWQETIIPAFEAKHPDIKVRFQPTAPREYDAALRANTAQLQHAKSALSAAQRKVDVLTTQRAQAAAQVDRARAVEQQAELNLSYAKITAPVDGTVGARTLRVGQYVQAGTQLMAVVPLDAVYVVANFKETQLTHVRNGQPVELTVDSFRGTTLKGHVDSLSPASGLEFALLPPDNATGNFTKVVQRIPVRIQFDKGQPLLDRLLPGMSVVTRINTGEAVANAGK